MLQLKKDDLDAMAQRDRARLVNGLTGYKSPFLLGSADADGLTNLALFSSVFHLGADPALIGLIFRPHSVPRHSLENILQTHCFTLNLAHADILEQTHQTSARYPREQSEFATTGLTEAYSEELAAPYVAESRLGIGLKLRQQIELDINQTCLIIGEICEVRMSEGALGDDGTLDMDLLGGLAVCGLDSYYQVRSLRRLAYAKP